MLALYRCGRQVEALDVYRATRRELVEALRRRARPGLRGLEQAILQHDPALAPDEPPSGRARAGSVSSWPGTRAACTARWPGRAAGPRAPARAHRGAAAGARRGRARGRQCGARGAGARRPDRRGPRRSSSRPGRGRPAPRRARRRPRARRGAAGVAHGELPGELVDLLAQPRRTSRCVRALPRRARRAGRDCPFGGAEHDWAAVELAAWLATRPGSGCACGARADHTPATATPAACSPTRRWRCSGWSGVVAEPVLVEASATGLAAAAAGATGDRGGALGPLARTRA